MRGKVQDFNAYSGYESASQQYNLRNRLRKLSLLTAGQKPSNKSTFDQ